MASDAPRDAGDARIMVQSSLVKPCPHPALCGGCLQGGGGAVPRRYRIIRTTTVPTREGARAPSAFGAQPAAPGLRDGEPMRRAVESVDSARCPARRFGLYRGRPPTQGSHSPVLTSSAGAPSRSSGNPGFVSVTPRMQTAEPAHPNESSIGQTFWSLSKWGFSTHGQDWSPGLDLFVRYRSGTLSSIRRRE